MNRKAVRTVTPQAIKKLMPEFYPMKFEDIVLVNDEVISKSRELLSAVEFSDGTFDLKCRCLRTEQEFTWTVRRNPKPINRFAKWVPVIRGEEKVG